MYVCRESLHALGFGEMEMWFMPLLVMNLLEQLWQMGKPMINIILCFFYMMEETKKLLTLTPNPLRLEKPRMADHSSELCSVGSASKSTTARVFLETNKLKKKLSLEYAKGLLF